MEIYTLFCVLILLSSTPFAVADSHSHYFFTTVTNDYTSDFPSYFTTKTIDDITLYWYDSENEIVERRVPWFKSTFATLLDASLNELKYQLAMQSYLESIMDYLNQTEGYHILQILEGCTVYGNGTIETVLSDHYDGKPFMSFNVETANWTADAPEARYFTEILNENTTTTEKIKNNLLNTCIPHIQELLLLGNSTFNRKAQPIVRVTHVPINNVSSRLYCRAYGHYPRDIAIVWYKNGQEISEEVMDRVTLPLPDLLYLTSLSFNITPLAGDIYTCKVSHSSSTVPVIQDWKVSDDSLHQTSGPSNGAVIAICLAVILLLVVVVFGAVSLGKSRRQ
ncbi:major histocompatibility complex class I-related protein 1-like [Mixophyes fleayi]|uniref:major histocompatibility complex class I-related protein 1-like n=1 Tax=Mixophyes fleayi TaxID=3061075 RepID=UPI003F4E039D